MQCLNTYSFYIELIDTFAVTSYTDVLSKVLCNFAAQVAQVVCSIVVIRKTATYVSQGDPNHQRMWSMLWNRSTQHWKTLPYLPHAFLSTLLRPRQLRETESQESIRAVRHPSGESTTRWSSLPCIALGTSIRFGGTRIAFGFRQRTVPVRYIGACLSRSTKGNEPPLTLASSPLGFPGKKIAVTITANLVAKQHWDS